MIGLERLKFSARRSGPSSGVPMRGPYAPAFGRRAVIRLEALKSAAHEFLTAALIGEDFEAALSQLTDAAGASDAVLSLDNGFTTKDAICTPGAVEGVRAFLSGDCPPNPRTMRCAPSLKEGFRVD